MQSAPSRDVSPAFTAEGSVSVSRPRPCNCFGSMLRSAFRASMKSGFGPRPIAVARSDFIVAILLGLIPVLGRRVDFGSALGRGPSQHIGAEPAPGRNVWWPPRSRSLASSSARVCWSDLRCDARSSLGLPSAMRWCSSWASLSRYRTRAEAKAFQRGYERLAAIPGVSSAGAVGSCLPLRGFMPRRNPRSRGSPDTGGHGSTGHSEPRLGYFRTMGIDIRGRAYTSADETGKATVVILSRAAGRTSLVRIRSAGECGSPVRAIRAWHTVVSVANDVRVRIETDEFRRLIYSRCFRRHRRPSLRAGCSDRLPPTSWCLRCGGSWTTSTRAAVASWVL